MKDVTRRGFVGFGATALAGAALAGMVGCASGSAGSDKEGQAVNGAHAEGSETLYAMRASGVEQFGIAPVKVSELGEPDDTCDWLVIGGGNTGLFAAAHGLDMGMKTILLEKNPMTGGAGVGTEVSQAFSDAKIMQENNAVSGTFPEIYHYFMMQNAWLSDAMLVSNYITHNHLVHDWLYDHGMGTVFAAVGGVEGPVGGIMYEGMGTGVNTKLAEEFEKGGGTAYLSTGATKLVIDEEGAVVGALADSKDKKDRYFSAKNVFIGTGGFGTNPEMVQFYIGQAGVIASKRDEQMGIPHNGDGIRMMLGAGAVESQDMWATAPAQGAPAHDMWDTEVDRACREANLWVNERGQRIGNEKWDAISSNFGAAYRQMTGSYWNIFDAKAVKRMETEDFLMGSRWVIPKETDGKPMPGMGEALDAAAESGTIFKADTLEELAQAAGIEPEQFTSTVDHYNEMCRAGADTDLWKDSAALNELGEAPYYAIEVVPAWFSTLNGVKVDADLHVLDSEGHPIKGLYAGGADASEFFKTIYSHGFGGSCSAFSYFCGYYAAEVAKKTL